MDEALRKFHIRTGVLDELGRHGIAHDNRMRAEIEAHATIAAGDNSRVIMKNGNSQAVEIESRLNSRMKESIASASGTVGKSDADRMRKNFADIAAGRVRVTD